MAKYKIIPSSRTIIHSPISIGHKAEKGVEAIEFDLTAWVETYGSGTLTVIMRRWGDAIPYPIALEIDENNKATWTLSDIDTAKAGMAYAQLNYIVGDEVVKKSDIYTFRVMDSLTGEGEPPEAYESWLEHLTHLAAEAMAEVLDIEGIVTDKTLTVDGGIADAKATGDALALKADKSTTYTKTEVDQMIEDVEVETDTTLSVSGAPADAKKTGDELSALRADLALEDFSVKSSATAIYASEANDLHNMIQNVNIPYGAKIFVKVDLAGGSLNDSKQIQIRANGGTFITSMPNRTIGRVIPVTLTGLLAEGTTITTIGINAARGVVSEDTTVTLTVWSRRDFLSKSSVLTNGFGLINTLAWEQGRYSATNGGTESGSSRIRTVNYISDDVGLVAINPGVEAELHAWKDDVFQGTWTGSKFEKTTTVVWSPKFDLTDIRLRYPGLKFKLTARKVNTTYSTIIPSDGENVYVGSVYALNWIDDKLQETVEDLQEAQTDIDSLKESGLVDYDSIIRSVNRIADQLPVPRQSIAGYKYAHDMGFKNLLCDLRFSSDGVPICTHDEYMNQVYSDVYLNGTLVPTNPATYFADLTYAELQDYDFGVYKGSDFAGTKILSFEQMLKLCKYLNCRVYIEMKIFSMTTAQFDTVFSLIAKYGMREKVVFAPQTIASLNGLVAYNPNVYIQFHTNTAGHYTDLPDSYVTAIVNATNAYNKGKNTILVPLSVGITNAQILTLANAGVGLCAGYSNTTNTIQESTVLDSYLSERPGIVEKLCMKIIAGKYAYDKVKNGEMTI